MGSLSVINRCNQRWVDLTNFTIVFVMDSCSSLIPHRPWRALVIVVRSKGSLSTRPCLIFPRTLSGRLKIFGCWSARIFRYLVARRTPVSPWDWGTTWWLYMILFHSSCTFVCYFSQRYEPTHKRVNRLVFNRFQYQCLFLMSFILWCRNRLLAG